MFVMTAYESILNVQLLAGSLILVSLTIALMDRPGWQFNSIPTVGFADPILSYLSAFYFDFFDATTVIKQGYEKVTLSK